MGDQNDNPDKNDELDKKLFSKSLPHMSVLDMRLLFEQYKLFVETAEMVSERRNKANTFFLSINTALITAISGFIAMTPQPSLQYGWMILASSAGGILCFTWWRLIQSYRQLNDGKYKIIHLLEARLPSRLFDAEWDVLNHGDGTVYIPFNKEERRVPLVFGGLYGMVFLFATGKFLGLF